MRNIPVFTTQYGAASLILESVAQRKEAFVRIQSSLDPEKLLQECKDFCVACGAQRVYATGHAALEGYPLHTAILQMCAPKETIGESDVHLFPLQQQTLSLWQEKYNEGMQGVDNAAWLSRQEMKKILLEGGAYFVHRSGALIGIGKVSADRIDAIVSLQRGAGADIVRALSRILPEGTVKVEVASTNDRAMALYQRLGFVVTGELSRWYQIF